MFHGEIFTPLFCYQVVDSLVLFFLHLVLCCRETFFGADVFWGAFGGGAVIL